MLIQTHVTVDAAFDRTLIDRLDGFALHDYWEDGGRLQLWVVHNDSEADPTAAVASRLGLAAQKVTTLVHLPDGITSELAERILALDPVFDAEQIRLLQAHALEHAEAAFESFVDRIGELIGSA